MKFKNIIFDWSGVIKDATTSHLWVVNRMMEELGGNAISLDEFRRNWEEPYMGFWKKYYPELSIEEEHAIYSKHILSKECPEADACAGVVDLIKKLKQAKADMIILSADMSETLLPEIKRFSLENVFSEVVTMAPNKTEKIHEVVVKHNFKPEETVFIGDSANEVRAGKSAGIKTIAVTWGLNSEGKLILEKPDYLVHNVKELEGILL